MAFSASIEKGCGDAFCSFDLMKVRNSGTKARPDSLCCIAAHERELLLLLLLPFLPLFTIQSHPLVQHTLVLMVQLAHSESGAGKDDGGRNS